MKRRPRDPGLRACIASGDRGVLAPNAPQRAQVSALARQPAPPLPKAADASPAPARSPARYLWAVLLARIVEILVPA